MLNTLEALTDLLQGTLLAGCTIRQLAIDESDEFAFEIQVPEANACDRNSTIRGVTQL